MGGQGSGRLPSEETIIKRMREPKTPLDADGIFIIENENAGSEDKT